MEQIKLTEQELEQVKKMRDEYNNKIIEFGQLKMEKIPIKKRWDKLNAEEEKLEIEIEKLQEIEENLAKTLNTKYGEGEFDLTSGIFTKK